MVRQPAVRHLAYLLTLVATGCASDARSVGGLATMPTAIGAAQAVVTLSSSTSVVPQTVATQPGEPTSTVPAPTSLAVWPTPANAIAVPAPSGEAAVGVAATGFPDTIAFYPAVAGTGRGHHRYVDPVWATAAGLDPTQMDRVVSVAQIDATPAPTNAPRPIVLLTPGWRSIVAFSTSLAEDLASHGYVVLATQTDVVAEWSHPKSTTEDRTKRLALLTHLLDFTETPALPLVVGPVDVHRIAVGGHSYAGTIAFDASITDRRISVMIDIDGSARGSTVRPPQPRPALVLVTLADGVPSEPLLGPLTARSPHIVPAGVLDALHLDVTDAASIPSVLGTSVFSTLVGPIGKTGTTDASTIIRRFLDATLGANKRQPTSAELVQGLPSVTADPFGSAAPA